MAKQTRILKWAAQVCTNCALCKHARKKQKGLLYRIVRLESRVCPFCRAYEKVHGKKAYEPHTG